MLAKILTSIMLLIYVIVNLVSTDNLIVTVAFLVMTGMSIFYLFFERDEKVIKETKNNKK